MTQFTENFLSYYDGTLKKPKTIVVTQLFKQSNDVSLVIYDDADGGHKFEGHAVIHDPCKGRTIPLPSFVELMEKLQETNCKIIFDTEGRNL